MSVILFHSGHTAVGVWEMTSLIGHLSSLITRRCHRSPFRTTPSKTTHIWQAWCQRGVAPQVARFAALSGEGARCFTRLTRQPPQALRGNTAPYALGANVICRMCTNSETINTRGFDGVFFLHVWWQGRSCCASTPPIRESKLISV